MAARPDSSTSVCVRLARNAACVLLKTPIRAMTMNESRVMTTITSTRVKAARGTVRRPQRCTPSRQRIMVVVFFTARW